MALSQVQIIRSLAEALAWFEKELAWGVEPAELRHLTGRIGELYAAMITRGQMALSTNQRGYDVVSSRNERISVKTFTSSTHVNFRKSTFDEVDRVIVLRINIEEGEASIEEIIDATAPELLMQCQEDATGYRFGIRHASLRRLPVDNLAVIASVAHGDTQIIQFENGTVVIDVDGERQAIAKPWLRKIAAEHGIAVLNGNGNTKNTRQLGADVIAALSS